MSFPFPYYKGVALCVYELLEIRKHFIKKAQRVCTFLLLKRGSGRKPPSDSSLPVYKLTNLILYLNEYFKITCPINP